MRNESARPRGTAYGIDACKGGWFYVALKPSGKVECGVCEMVADLVRKAEETDRLFIDIPIGLPHGREERACDRKAREKLGSPRGCSVFRTPVRKALSATCYDEAKRFSREETCKAVTKQTFAIMPKIKEVDDLLRRCEKARRIVSEVHPEICFWSLAGESPMCHSKKKREGRRERLEVLKSVFPSACAEFERIRKCYPCSKVAPDDILDAMAAAVTARADQRDLRTLPSPEADCLGLSMKMVYAPKCAVNA